MTDDDEISHTSTSTFTVTRPRGDLVIKSRANYRGTSSVHIISLAQPEGQIPLDGTTDSSGNIRFNDVLCGEYTFQASKDGYHQITFKSDVTEIITNNKIISLTEIVSVDGFSPSGILFEAIVVSASILVVATVLLKVFFYVEIPSGRINELLSALKKPFQRVQIRKQETGILVKEAPREEVPYVAPREEERQVAPQVRAWQQLTYYVKENGDGILVGEWRSQDVGYERQIMFKPLHPIKQEDMRIWGWLGQEITRQGKGTISEGGEITVLVPKNIKYGKLLSQVSWVYYTLLKENKLI